MPDRDLLEVDARWSRKMRIAERPSALRTAAAILAHSGDSWFWLIALGIILWLASPHWKAWALKMIAAILVSALLVMTLKLLFRRRRPEGHWGSIYRNTDPHSFPSGHAARAALLAVLISAWGPAWLAPIAVIWAPLVSLARVALGVHYISDVIGGTILGLLISMAAIISIG